MLKASMSKLNRHLAKDLVNLHSKTKLASLLPNKPKPLPMASPFKSTSLKKAIGLVVGFSVLALDGPFKPASALTVTFPDFSDVSAWQLNGSAAQAGSVLRVTPSLPGQSGSAFLTNPISLLNQNSFSAFFQFRMSNPGGSTDTDGVQGADGIVFALQTVSNTAGGAGGGIGFLGLPNSVGVEFDSWNNGSIDQSSGNHIGIDLNGSVASDPLAPVAPILNDGSVYNAWVDYNGLADILEVRFSANSARPATPLLSKAVDLESILDSSSAFVGFTSGTGSAYNDHDILSFTFVDDFKPIDPGTAVPGPVPFLGVAAAFSYSRKLRNRMKSSS